MSYDNQNIFAKIIRNELPSEKVYEDTETMAIMDIMPRANGHVLVIPKSACRNMLDATEVQLLACMKTVKKVSLAMLNAFAADGITIQQFNETAGGQEVFHLHYHVLPRHDGVPIRQPSAAIEKMEVLKENAEKIRKKIEI